jgi:glyoxylase-like metal-dependent hydrolase (beta-lactamase superfamily II)
MEEVAPEIFRITEKGFLGAIRPPVNIYVLAGADGLIFDAGYGNRKDIRFFIKEFTKIQHVTEKRGIAFAVRRILPSHAHPDHFSGLAALRKALGLSVVLTRSTARIISSRDVYRASYNIESGIPTTVENTFLRTIKQKTISRGISFLYERLFGTEFLPDPDAIIDDNSDISINGQIWRIIHSPGHSVDHISLYNPNSGILFAGDNILRSITTWLGPPKSDLSAYIDSLEMLRALPNLKLILSAHGSAITTPQERISELIQWRHERTSHVLDLVRKGGDKGITLRDMLEALYEKESWIKHRMAEGWVIVTLEYLEKEKLVRHDIYKNKIYFFAADAI